MYNYSTWPTVLWRIIIQSVWIGFETKCFFKILVQTFIHAFTHFDPVKEKNMIWKLYEYRYFWIYTAKFGKILYLRIYISRIKVIQGLLKVSLKLELNDFSKTVWTLSILTIQLTGSMQSIYDNQLTWWDKVLKNKTHLVLKSYWDICCFNTSWHSTHLPLILCESNWLVI